MEVDDGMPRAAQIAAGLPTAGAIPVRTAKGEVTMQKVKVQRYVAGKRPAYAPEERSDSDVEEEEESKTSAVRTATSGAPRMGFNIPRESKKEASSSENEEDEPSTAELLDPRLRRLKAAQIKDEEGSDSDSGEDMDRVERHKRLREPEVLEPGFGEDEEEEEEELDEDELESRRAVLRKKVHTKREEEELLALEEEPAAGADEEEEEEEFTEEEYTDSEEDDLAPRLKPVFVRKKERVTVHERQRAEARLHNQESDLRREAEQRRRQTLRLVQEEARKAADEAKAMQAACDALCSDDDDPHDEEAYEAWKVRELRRIRRDREAREQRNKEKEEVDRLRGMTEEQRREELRRNPKEVLNKAPKGKYRYLQKYYHRGAFYLDVEENVLKRDVAQPTLEDKFDKTVLPKVMQVKNFGRAGRTKYTHLVDQDTAGPDQREGMWQMDTALSRKFHDSHAGGMKQSFERPSGSKRRRDN